MILEALFAANCLLPVGPYQATHIVADLQFIPGDAVAATCIQHHINSRNGCEWGYGSNIHIRLAQGTSERESCNLRHALGHIYQFETTGNANPQHTGWEYAE